MCEPVPNKCISPVGVYSILVSVDGGTNLLTLLLGRGDNLGEQGLAATPEDWLPPTSWNRRQVRCCKGGSECRGEFQWEGRVDGKRVGRGCVCGGGVDCVPELYTYMSLKLFLTSQRV